MTPLLLLIGLAAGIALLVYALKEPPPPPPVYPPHSFKAAFRNGEMEVFIEYESNPILPSVEMITRRWAIELVNPQPSKQLYEALERELTGFPVAVIDLRLPAPVPAPPTPAELLQREIDSMLKQSTTIAEAQVKAPPAVAAWLKIKARQLVHDPYWPS